MLAPELLTQTVYASSGMELEECKAADVYAFAITLWEILHRNIPWAGNSREEIRQYVVAGHRPLTAEKYQAVLTTDDTKLVFIRELIAECWHMDPSSRLDFRSILKQLKTVMEQQVDYTNQKLNQINTNISNE